MVPSIALHAAGFLLLMFGGHVLNHARVVPEEHHVDKTQTMMAWIVPVSAESLQAAAPEPVVTIRSRKAVHAAIRINPEPVQPNFTRPEPQPVSLEALALFRPPSSAAAPADENFSVLFVGIENGEWLRWLAERHGFIGFTTHRDDVIEHVYSVSGDLLSTSTVTLADVWALELDQPERVAAIADMLARERERVEDFNSRIRIFAMFPTSFRDEVAAAIRRAGGTGGTFRVSFSGNELHVAAPTPSQAAR